MMMMMMMMTWTEMQLADDTLNCMPTAELVTRDSELGVAKHD